MNQILVINFFPVVEIFPEQIVVFSCIVSDGRIALAARNLEDLSGCPEAAVDGLVGGFALGQLSQKAADESVSGSVGVHDLVGRQLVDGMLADGAVLHHDAGISALGDDDRAGLGSVALVRQSGDLLGDFAAVALEVVVFSEGFGLGFVSDDDVGVLEDVLERLLEELTDEGGREIDAELFVGVLCRVLGHLEHGVRADGDEESGAVKDLGLFHHRPVFWNLQMRGGEVVGRVQLGHERTVVAGDEHGTPSSRVLLVLLVVDGHAGLGCNFGQDLVVLVVTDATEVGGALGLFEDPLSHADGVLSGTAGDVFDGVVSLQVVVNVLLFVQDRVVGVQVVLFQHGRIDDGRDVQQGISDAKDGGHDDLNGF